MGTACQVTPQGLHLHANASCYKPEGRANLGRQVFSKVKTGKSRLFPSSSSVLQTFDFDASMAQFPLCRCCPHHLSVGFKDKFCLCFILPLAVSLIHWWMWYQVQPMVSSLKSLHKIYTVRLRGKVGNQLAHDDYIQKLDENFALGFKKLEYCVLSQLVKLGSVYSKFQNVVITISSLIFYHDTKLTHPCLPSDLSRFSHQFDWIFHGEVLHPIFSIKDAGFSEFAISILTLDKFTSSLKSPMSRIRKLQWTLNPKPYKKLVFWKPYTLNPKP